jgi:hypothetical protein
VTGPARLWPPRFPNCYEGRRKSCEKGRDNQSMAHSGESSSRGARVLEADKRRLSTGYRAAAIQESQGGLRPPGSRPPGPRARVAMMAATRSHRAPATTG